jgi:hypothetical protein
MRKLISVAAGLAASFCFSTAFAASSAVTELDVAALTDSLNTQSLSFGGWTYRSVSEADNGGSFSQTVSPTADSDADVSGVAALSKLGHVHANSNGGKGAATMELISDFSLASGAHMSFYVPYSVSLQSGHSADNNSGNVFFEVKNVFNNSVVFSQDVTFSSGDLQYRVAGSNDAQANTILVDFYNGTGATANYTFFGHINATSDAVFAAAVPEPQTYAMLFAGIAFLGIMLRRRIF